MTSGRTSKLIRKLKDSNWRYWNLVDHEADVAPVDPEAFHMIQFGNNLLTLQLLGRKVDPERWRKYALWHPVDRKEDSRQERRSLSRRHPKARGTVIVPARGVMKWGYQDDESQD